jgi:hypothetical protein
MTDEQKTKMEQSWRNADAARCSQPDALRLADCAIKDLAPYLLGPVTEEEINDHQLLPSYEDMTNAVLSKRLAAVKPKPVDPRREKLRNMLSRPALATAPRDVETIISNILAALDAE